MNTTERKKAAELIQAHFDSLAPEKKSEEVWEKLTSPVRKKLDEVDKKISRLEKQKEDICNHLKLTPNEVSKDLTDFYGKTPHQIEEYEKGYRKELRDHRKKARSAQAKLQTIDTAEDLKHLYRSLKII